jgi:DinB family protein
MNSKDTLRDTLNLSHFILKSYVGDFTDADLMRRAGKGCNHVAYQLGHLIASECDLLNGIRPGSAPELPAGFAQQHKKENAGSDDPAKFLTKQQYLELTEKVHAATLALLESYPEADFEKPAPESFRKMFPTMGSIFILIATHPMMHAGQFVPIRRALGKPIVI